MWLKRGEGDVLKSALTLLVGCYVCAYFRQMRRSLQTLFHWVLDTISPFLNRSGIIPVLWQKNYPRMGSLHHFLRRALRDYCDLSVPIACCVPVVVSVAPLSSDYTPCKSTVIHLSHAAARSEKSAHSTACGSLIFSWHLWLVPFRGFFSSLEISHLKCPNDYHSVHSVKSGSGIRIH